MAIVGGILGLTRLATKRIKTPCHQIEQPRLNIARKCKIRVSKCKEALANSEAQRKNLEPFFTASAASFVKNTD